MLFTWYREKGGKNKLKMNPELVVFPIIFFTKTKSFWNIMFSTQAHNDSRREKTKQYKHNHIIQLQNTQRNKRPWVRNYKAKCKINMINMFK